MYWSTGQFYVIAIYKQASIVPPEITGSCDSVETPFTMYFTVNSAFQYFMSEFGLSDSHSPDGRLLSQEYIFDIFLNDTSKPSIHPNTSRPILPLDPPDTLLELFQSISSKAPYFPQFTFFPYCLAYQYENSKLS